MSPDKIDPVTMRDACDRCRDERGEIEVDDELLAMFIDGGIDAVPFELRASILRAIGSQPDIAAVVASLATVSGEASSVIATVGPFGVNRRTWIRSWAACALLAVAMTVWLVVAVSPYADHGVQLLGSDSVMATETSSGNSFHITLLKITVGILWLTQCLFFIPLILNRKKQKASLPIRVR